MSIDLDSPLAQAISELILHERADDADERPPVGSQHLRALADDDTWLSVCDATIDQLYAALDHAGETLNERDMLQRIFLRAALLTASAAEVRHRREQPLHPPTEGH